MTTFRRILVNINPSAGAHPALDQAEELARRMHAALAMVDVLPDVPDRARRFVHRTLGPLASGDEATRRLLDTLRVFQEEGQSFARTAARLEVHQNTAAYRVKRALELAGKDDASSLALRAAVSLVPLVGDADDPRGA